MYDSSFILVCQVVCLVTFSVLSIILITSHFLPDHCSRRYEVSRLMTIVAMLIYVAHFVVQMTFGLRLEGQDVGALVNILFFAPAGYLLSYAQLRLETNGRNLTRFITVSIVAYVLILLLTGVGISLCHSLHVGGWFYAIDAVYCISILFAFGMPMVELRRISRRLDSELGEPADNYTLCMTVGSLIMLIFAGSTPFYIAHNEITAIVFPFTLIAMTIYVIIFIIMGLNMRGITELVESGSVSKEETAEADDSQSNIEMLINQWQKNHGYRDSELTLLSFCRLTGISKAAFSRYLLQHRGVTFRVWLSGIRMDEAKRLLREHPEYSHDAIATECGFTSRVYFQRLFKASTGMTPLEWKNQH